MEKLYQVTELQDRKIQEMLEKDALQELLDAGKDLPLLSLNDVHSCVVRGKRLDVTSHYGEVMIDKLELFRIWRAKYGK